MAIYKAVATEVLVQDGVDGDGNPITVTFNPGDVVTRVVWDGEAEFTPPVGTELVLDSGD